MEGFGAAVERLFCSSSAEFLPNLFTVLSSQPLEVVTNQAVVEKLDGILHKFMMSDRSP
jgi:hypothetical protein